MSKLRSWLRSELSNLTETNAILTKIAGLFAQKNTRVVFQKDGQFRMNASLCDSVVIDPTLSHNNIQFSLPPIDGGFEAFTVFVPTADDGVLEIDDVQTVADVSGSLNSKYWLFEDVSGTHKYYVWYNINSAGVDPAIGGRTGIQVTGATGANANTLAGSTRTAISGSAAGTYFTVSGSTNHVTLTEKLLGAGVGAADGTAATSFTFTNTPGHACSRQSSYFTFADEDNTTKYYAWYNCHSEGVDPALGGYTGVPIAVNPGDSAGTIASTIATAIAALDSSSDFTATANSSTVSVTLKATGGSTLPADGTTPTGFTIMTQTSVQCYDTAQLQLLRRLRTKKWLIHIKPDADPSFKS